MSAAYKSNYHTNGSVQESLVIISASISQYNNNAYNSRLTQQKKFQRLRPRADWSSGTS